MTFKESILVFLTKNEKGHTKQAKNKVSIAPRDICFWWIRKKTWKNGIEPSRKNTEYGRFIDLKWKDAED